MTLSSDRSSHILYLTHILGTPMEEVKSNSEVYMVSMESEGGI